MPTEAQKAQGGDSPGASFNHSSQEKRIQLCSDKILASSWDSNGVKFIAKQAVRQVPQYSLLSQQALHTVIPAGGPYPSHLLLKSLKECQTCQHGPVTLTLCLLCPQTNSWGLQQNSMDEQRGGAWGRSCQALWC